MNTAASHLQYTSFRQLIRHEAFMQTPLFRGVHPRGSGTACAATCDSASRESRITCSIRCALGCSNHCFANIGTAPSPRIEFRLTYVFMVCHSASSIAGIDTAYLRVLGSHDLPPRKTVAKPSMTGFYQADAMRLCHALQVVSWFLKSEQPELVNLRSGCRCCPSGSW